MPRDDSISVVAAPLIKHSQPELRRDPRFEVDVAAELLSEQGEISFCQLRNVSHSGLQLEVDVDCLHHLMPADCTHDLHHPVHLKVHFTAPDCGQVAVECALIYCRRQRQNRYCVGVEFCSFSAGSDAHLHAWIEQLARQQ